MLYFLNKINIDNPYIFVIGILFIVFLIIAIYRGYSIDLKNYKFNKNKKDNIKDIFRIAKKIHDIDNQIIYECMEYLEMQVEILYDNLLELRIKNETEGFSKEDKLKIKNIYLLIYNIHKNRMLDIFRKEIIKKFKIDKNWEKYKKSIYDYTIVIIKNELKRISNEILSGELIKYNIIIIHKDNHKYYKEQLYIWLEEFKNIYHRKNKEKKDLYLKLEEFNK